MTAPQAVVLLLAVDNTLLGDDAAIADLRGRLEREFGAASASCYSAADLSAEHSRDLIEVDIPAPFAPKEK